MDKMPEVPTQEKFEKLLSRVSGLAIVSRLVSIYVNDISKTTM